jgi:hypothetical protein
VDGAKAMKGQAMAKKETTADETFEQRVKEFLQTADDAAFYLYGLADALELMHTDLTGVKELQIIRRLRFHAWELAQGKLFVEHGYKEGKP